jgi:AcrR family transcriptional regulator
MASSEGDSTSRHVTTGSDGEGSPELASDTRQRLIAAARDVICDVGLKRARMEDIAAVAGVSRAAVYYHFHTKGELVAAIVDDVFLRLTDTVRGALADGPLDGIIAATVRFFADQIAVARLLISDMEVPPDPKRLLAQHRNLLVAVIRRRVSTDIAAGRVRPMDPEVAAQAIASLIRVAPMEMICNESADLDHLTTQLTDFLRHALGASPVPGSRQ